jgi:hypothetical protein
MAYDLSRSSVEADVSVVAPLAVSRAFLVAFRLHTLSEPQWALCGRSGVPAGVFSRLVRGLAPLRPNDPRILKVAQQLGIAAGACFEYGAPQSRE